MPFETIHYEVREQIAYITFNRPQAANSMTLEMLRELMEISLLCETNKNLRVVLLKAEGSKFSVGGDLASFAAAGDQISLLLRQMTTYLHAAISRFLRMSAPLVVAVNGVAAGAGFSLAAAGDLVLAAKSAKFTMAYTGAGLTPDGASTYVLPRLIGIRRTKELMLTNRLLSATEAQDWGIVNRVVEDQDLLGEAEKLVQTLAHGPTQAYGAVKTLLLSAFSEALETQLEMESRAIAQAGTTQDGKEGIAAFLSKRIPQFQGF